MQSPIEANYPISFREKEAAELGFQLKHFHSVTLTGIKRVGISNFLRYFLYHPQVQSTYLSGQNHLFIPIDLNDLVEIDLYAFWRLVLKRIADTIEDSALPIEIKKLSDRALSQSFQLQDIMVTIDNSKKVLSHLVANQIFPTLFLIRFDRLQSRFTNQFLANLQSLVDATDQKATYVFTSYRPLHQLSPKVFTKTSLSTFAHDVYLPPANPEDTKIIMSTFADRYELHLPEELQHQLITLSGGHVQYLHLALLKLKYSQEIPLKLESFLQQDEEIQLVSDEIYNSLTISEQELLLQLMAGNTHSKITDSYICKTGIYNQKGQLFSPLFAHFLSQLSDTNSAAKDFTRKEHLLFELLKANINQTVERDTIVETVWPEQTEMGVSDWAIDRLISRLRSKLRNQKAEYEIVTVVTRGYMMKEKS